METNFATLKSPRWNPNTLNFFEATTHAKLSRWIEWTGPNGPTSATAKVLLHSPPLMLGYAAANICFIYIHLTSGQSSHRHWYSIDIYIYGFYGFHWLLICWVILRGSLGHSTHQPGALVYFHHHVPSRCKGSATGASHGRLTFPKRMSDLRLWSDDYLMSIHVLYMFILFYHFFKLTWLTRWLSLWLSLPRSPAIDMNAPLVGLPIGCNLRRKLQEATAYCSQSGYENLRLLGSAVGGWFTPSFLGASFEHQPHQPHFFGLGTSINPWNHPKLLVTFRFVAKSLLIGVPVVYTFGAFLAAAFVQVMPSFSRTWLHRRSHTSSRPEMSCQLDDDVTSRKPRSEPPKKCSMLLEFPLFC